MCAGHEEGVYAARRLGTAILGGCAKVWQWDRLTAAATMAPRTGCSWGPLLLIASMLAHRAAAGVGVGN